MSILIVQVSEKAHSSNSAGEWIWSGNFWTVKHDVYSQLSCFFFLSFFLQENLIDFCEISISLGKH